MTVSIPFAACGKQRRNFRCQIRISYTFLNRGQSLFLAIFCILYLILYQMSIDLGKPFRQARTSFNLRPNENITAIYQLKVLSLGIGKWKKPVKF